CVVPDHIGCGFSEKPFHYNYTLSQHIDNLETLVDTLDLRDLTLVLHDWGGAIG
ncbi:MAG: alpha/beta fold hydrolase, partial [Nitrospinaceae bacterium]|nr:alpha/beta fold hydrolase [Nitrospinaceae bacterium]NIR53793.1 alpha/beta fold hydrolase [Nitrospinaceae bacterium]NIS84203.1 alpha/beta fold hydrolase [Nitrospinaceae bacterium]NIT81009.1 alpha/beta fold hydrolase [Nitrospinaceae bacterium]NIU43299.1 alpha/beta fold hydrolase [Nitrospinaceae bacterium]